MMPTFRKCRLADLALAAFSHRHESRAFYRVRSQVATFVNPQLSIPPLRRNAGRSRSCSLLHGEKLRPSGGDALLVQGQARYLGRFVQGCRNSIRNKATLLTAPVRRVHCTRRLKSPKRRGRCLQGRNVMERPQIEPPVLLMIDSGSRNLFTLKTGNHHSLRVYFLTTP